MREDEDAERARRVDEAGGGDRLAGRGRVAEAVAADRAGILLRRQLDFLVLVVLAVGERLVVVLLVDELLDDGVPVAVLSSWRCVAAISSVSIPASASIWCRRSGVPAAVCGSGSASTRSSPSISA